jgi:hypothetical protein
MKLRRHSLLQSASAAGAAASAAANISTRSNAEKRNLIFRKSIDFLK